MEERAPAREEVKAHMVSHMPFRSWCDHCVKGNASGNPHRRRKEEDRELREAVVSVDYLYE